MPPTLNPPRQPAVKPVGAALQTGKEWGVQMYLKRIDGPRAVTLPDGTVMTRADLPARETRRWVVSRKAAVVRAVAHGLITREEAMQLYGLSAEELTAWHHIVETHGEAALRVTMLKRLRQV